MKLAILTFKSMVSTADFMSYLSVPYCYVFYILWNDKRELINIGFDSSISSQENVLLNQR